MRCAWRFQSRLMSVVRAFSGRKGVDARLIIANWCESDGEVRVLSGCRVQPFLVQENLLAAGLGRTPERDVYVVAMFWSKRMPFKCRPTPMESSEIVRWEAAG